MEKVLKLLKVDRTPKQKKALLEPLVSKEPILADILRLAQYFNWSGFRITKATNKILLSSKHTDIVLEDLTLILNRLLEGSKPVLITTSGTLELVKMVLGPSAIGIGVSTINILLIGSTRTIIDAKETFGIQLELGALKECPICNRGMKSVIDEKACNSCENILRDFTNFRRGPFVVKINNWNFPTLNIKPNDKPVSFHYLDYRAYKVDDSIILEHAQYQGPKLQLPLPFKEFTKRIVN